MLRTLLRTWAPALAVLLLIDQSIAAAGTLDMQAVNAAAPKPGPSVKGPDPAVIKAQVLLDRARYSPGAISGRLDDNTRKAIEAFEDRQHLTIDGRLGPDLWMALTATSDAPVLMQYTIREEDVRGPFLNRLPARMEEMEKLPRLSYTSPRQALAAKFHMSEALLVALNPGKSFDQAGNELVVADPGAGRPRGPVGRIEVDKPLHMLRAFGKDDELIAIYPASIGSTEKPAPSGTFKVTSVSHDPTYRYDPAYAFKGVKTRKPFTIRPGPNNPVGLVWIGLTDKGYGIHGTPDPANVGKTASHGCIRLTNWDALDLAGMVRKGVPVDFLDQTSAPQLLAVAAQAQPDAPRAHPPRSRRR
jgi:lipoprotein-anchoring transpeptidase ErfK/SrfK